MESLTRIDPDIERRMRAAALPGQDHELERLNLVPLRGATSERWIRHALAHLNDLLDDHCQCELKAASNALAIVGRNPNLDKLVTHLSGLCREEMRHYRQVRDELQSRGGRLTRPLPSPYLKAVNRERLGSEHALLDDLMVAALVEARNTRRFFEDAAAVLRLGVDQFRDLALPNKRRRMRTSRRIGEQHLNVARPHVLGIGLVGRSRVARNPADDVQLVLIVETGRCEPFAVVDRQRHLGEISGRTGGGAGEDHVFHTAAAHRGRAIFAHHPTQGLKKVRLSAAVRPHDAGQAVMDQ